MARPYRKCLDALRAFAVLSVMAVHAGLFSSGWAGVQLFFVLSGFLITEILLDVRESLDLKSYLKRFYARRALRIFPLYFCYLGILFLALFIFNFPKALEKYGIYALTYTFNFTRADATMQWSPYLTHLWSLCIEEHFYLVWPLVVYLCPKKSLKWVLVGVIALSPLIRFYMGNYWLGLGLKPPIVGESIYWHTLTQLDSFAFGALIPVFGLERFQAKAGAALLVSAIVAGLLGTLSFSHFAQTPDLDSFGYVFPLFKQNQHLWGYTILNLCFSMLIFWSLKPPGYVKSVLNWRPLAYVGKISYGIYIFHWPILHWYERSLGIDNRSDIGWAFFALYSTTVIVAAAISYHLLEKPFLNLKRWFQY